MPNPFNLISLTFAMFSYLFFFCAYTSAAIIEYEGLGLERDFHGTSWYVAPNEKDIHKGVALWKKTTDGIYVAVGSERGFVGAALSNASSLLLIDSSSGIVEHNRLSIALLKIAIDGEDYRILKLNPELAASRLSNSNLEEDEKRFALNVLEKKWWIDSAKSRSTTDWFYRVRDRRDAKELRYWANPSLFSKLRRMALKGRIQAIRVVLGDQYSTNSMLASLREQSEKIAVFDVSNIWEAPFVGSSMNELLKNFELVSKNDTIVIATWVKSGDYFIEYLGASIGYLKSKEWKFDSLSQLIDMDKKPFNRSNIFLFSGNKCSDLMK